MRILLSRAAVGLSVPLVGLLMACETTTDPPIVIDPPDVTTGEDGNTPDTTEDTTEPTPDTPATDEGSTPDEGPTPDVEQDTGEPPTPENVPLRGKCELDNRYGGFIVQEDLDFGYVDGKIQEGVVPANVLTVELVDGDCRLLRRTYPFCNPPCAAGETCDYDGSCLPFPEPQDLGTVTVTGLVSDGPVVMEPKGGNSYFDTTLPNPPFEPNKVIHLTSTGGAFGPLDMWGVGVKPLELGETQWDVEEGLGLTVTWDAPVGPVRSTVFVTINIDQHGNSPVVLDCNFPDTGSGVVAASTLDALLNAGVSGFPNGVAMRRTVDNNDITLVAGGETGCAEFTVGSVRLPDVRVAGHTPCTKDDDCPTGQTCNVPIETCQ